MNWFLSDSLIFKCSLVYVELKHTFDSSESMQQEDRVEIAMLVYPSV